MVQTERNVMHAGVGWGLEGCNREIERGRDRESHSFLIRCDATEWMDGVGLRWCEERRGGCGEREGEHRGVDDECFS